MSDAGRKMDGSFGLKIGLPGGWAQQVMVQYVLMVGQ